MALARFCGRCGSTDIQKVRVLADDEDLPLPDPSTQSVLHFHHDGPLTEMLAAIEARQSMATNRVRALAVYVHAFPTPLTDRDVMRVLVEGNDSTALSRKTDVASRCFELRDVGWIGWTGKQVRDHETGHLNNTATLTRRAVRQLGLADPEDLAVPDPPSLEDLPEIIASYLQSPRRRRVVRRPTNWST